MTSMHDAIVNRRGMITIPKVVRDRFGLKEGSRLTFIVVDGMLEVVPLRTIEEMEAACTLTKEQVKRIHEEDEINELRLENEGP